MTSASKRGTGSEGLNRRSAARIAAVQALYQMDIAGTDVADVIDQFQKLRFDGSLRDGGHESNGEAGADVEAADPVFFAEIVRGVVRRQREIDPLVDQQLATGWRLKRIDSTLRAILRAGVFELMDRPDVPPRVAITEYINVAHAFFDDDGPRVVNGVLDAIARQLRPVELGARKSD